jgi:hypothetical protein
MARKKQKRVSKKKDGLFSEPVFDDIVVEGELMDIDADQLQNINIRINKGLNFYNYHYTSKHSKQPLIQWMESQKIVDKESIKKIRAAKDWQLGNTVGSVARMLNNGCPPMDNLLLAIRKKIKEISDTVVIEDEKEEIKQLAPAISIQERMKLNLDDFLGKQVEGEIDDFFQNKFKSDFKMSNALLIGEITGKAAALIPAIYAQEVVDFNTLLNPVEKDDEYEQLVEAYPYKKAEIKRILEFYNMIIDDAIHHSNIQKANRKIRVKKAPSKEKQIAKLKYKANDDRYKLVSIDPKNIIGAKELWVFNIKTRKIGKYVSTNGFSDGELGIKGTSITGFDTNTSMQKTLRKPEESLKEFASAGKVVLRKFLNNLTTTGIKLNGRVNSDVILLKVF